MAACVRTTPLLEEVRTAQVGAKHPFSEGGQRNGASSYMTLVTASFTRHAFATHALAAGLTAHAVAQFLGHSDAGLVWAATGAPFRTRSPAPQPCSRNGDKHRSSEGRCHAHDEGC